MSKGSNTTRSAPSQTARSYSAPKSFGRTLSEDDWDLTRDDWNSIFRQVQHTPVTFTDERGHDYILSKVGKYQYQLSPQSSIDRFGLINDKISLSQAWPNISKTEQEKDGAMENVIIENLRDYYFRKYK